MYTQKTLSKNEQILNVFSLHWINYVRLGILVTSTVVVGSTMAASPSSALQWIFVACLSFSVIEFLRLKTIEQTLTTSRVVFKKGIIARHTEEMKNKQVETVELRQSILGRMLGYATIKVSGSGSSVVVFEAVKNPLQVKSQIESAVEAV